MLRKRINDLQERGYRDLRERAALLAENKRLKRQLEETKESPAKESKISVAQETERSQTTTSGQDTDESESIEVEEDEDSLSDDSSYKSPSAKVRGRKKGKQNEWKRDSPYETEKYCHYICPVPGCDRRFRVTRAFGPPLLSDGRTLNDKVFWKGNRLNNVRSAVRGHMRNEHAEVRESDWPKGFSVQRT